MTVSGATGIGAPNPAVALAVAAAQTLVIAGNLIALMWFGMWMGLNSKNASLSTLKTILFVQIVPWLVASFASMLIVPLVMLPTLMKGAATAPARFMAWYPLLLAGVGTVLYLAKDVAFTIWARRKLYSEFRERAAQVLGPTGSNPPPLPPRVAAPLIITGAG